MKPQKPHPQTSKAQKPKTPKGALWTTPMRHVLCCLFRFFNDNGPGAKVAFERVFSQMFHTHIVQRRKQDTLPFNTIYTQWAWMRRQANPVWKHAHIDTPFSHDKDWKTVIENIQNTAAALKIKLVERTSDTTADPSYVENFDHSQHLAESLESVLLLDTSLDARRAREDAAGRAQEDAARRAREDAAREEIPHLTANEDISHGEPIPMELDDHDPQIQSDRKPQADTYTSSRLVHSHGKQCLWCHMEGEQLVDDNQGSENQVPGFNLNTLDHEPAQAVIDSVEDYMDLAQDPTPGALPGLCSTSDLPPLLYRWSNGGSQGTNRRDLFEAKMFKSQAELYSPDAISKQTFLEHFRNHVTKAKVKTPFISTFTHPLAPIHRAIHEQNGATVSVIDPTKVDTPIFKANKLVPVTQTATHSWRGHGEFEIWGRVPSEAIVCTFYITTLEAIRGQDEEGFLQLEVIRAHKRCNSVLYNALAKNLDPSKREYYISALKGLGELLGVPEGYRTLVAQSFFEAWALRDRFRTLCDGHRDIDDGMNLLTTTRSARGSDSDDTFHPRASGSESSLGSTSSEDVESSTEIVEAWCPRRDTPSDGFSVDDESSVCSSKQNQAVGHTVAQPCARPKPRPVPYTPPSSGYSREKHDAILRDVGPITFKSFARRATPTRTPDPEVIDLEPEWPSDDVGPETPVRSRFFGGGEEV